MTWTAPEITRTGGSLTGSEREMLEGYLGFYRSTLLMKCAGMTGEQLAEQGMPPSTLTLLGLIRHLAKVERIWFRIRLAGEELDPLYDTERKNQDFEEADPAQAEEDYDRLLEEWRLADEAAASRSLDDTFSYGGDEYSVRLVYFHMIGEYARHCGHADLVREGVDGTTGA